MIFSDLVVDARTAPETYAREGVVCFRQLLPREEIDLIRKTFTDEVESVSASGSGSGSALAHNDHVPADDVLARYPRFVHPHRHPETDAGRVARRYLVDQRLVRVAESLIGDAYGAQTMFYFKPPGARGQAMHQDNWFLKAHPETCLAAWVCIDDADEENGGLMFVPGSHRNDVLCHGDSDPSISFSKNTVPIPEGLARVQSELQAGDVVFFHGSMVHGSMPNRSNDRFRRSLILHYVPRASSQVAEWYLPLIDPRDAGETRIAAAPLGGPCGEAWTADEGAYAAAAAAAA
ncbi:hypothetical protein JCM24511_06106 [Saitozyma sp. JCM 24511]|nr:hypothetical protein JCM24511_06106 [Saitozyma sp. JCM 24511]